MEPMQYTIRIDQRDIEFPCEEGQTVLDGALAAGYEIPYSCRTGICGSCRGRIVRGDVRGGAGDPSPAVCPLPGHGSRTPVRDIPT
ncbi:2Fe-2S iron-sulfur cluster binding domain-containing protein [Alcaligenaceae bacterium SAGV3]|nr:2Fe-2S iron-sulfur cluster binding domain-containing protein [Alcaligenaceae bacterium SAGV3]